MPLTVMKGLTSHLQFNTLWMEGAISTSPSLETIAVLTQMKG